MAQFLKVRVQTDIRARRRVKERQYGHSQQDNSTAHTTKKSMSSLIPDLNETITSVGTWKEKCKSNHPPTATVIQNETYANVSVLRINFRCKKFVVVFFLHCHARGNFQRFLQREYGVCHFISLHWNESKYHT